jgi:DNA-binding transcriptional regulator/RsmH inhibitor MraZ
MNINVPQEKTYTRKADKQGRINLPAKEYAGKTLEIAIIGQDKDDSVSDL